MIKSFTIMPEQQTPNLEQVFVIALVPLLFLALALLGLIFVLWMKARLLQKRIDALTDDVRTLAGRLQARETDQGQ